MVTRPLIERYAGSSITFNLVKASKAKKENGNEQCSKEIMSKVWEDDEDGNHLNIRLIFDDLCRPWLIAHCGTCVIFQGPLFIPINADDDTLTLDLFFRDYGQRKQTKYVLHFASLPEA